MTTAAEMRDLYIEAEQDLLKHGQSSRLGDRILTMADLPAIREGRKEWEARARTEARPGGAPSLPHSLADLTTRA